MKIKFPKIKIKFLEKNKELIKPFFVLFIIISFLGNFDNIAILFNKRIIDNSVVSMIESSEIVKTINAPIIEQQQIEWQQNNPNQVPQQEVAKNYVFEGSYIEIPKLGIKADLSFPLTDSKEEVEKALIGHVMFFPGSAYPGEKGDVFLLAHSAPNNWPWDYKIFNTINQLETGDTILVYFNNRLFRYNVVKNFIIKPGETIVPTSVGQYSIHLLTCWPPGSSKNRMVVEGGME